MARDDDSVATVGDVPVCPGCGLAAHVTHGDVCGECFQRREGWLGGGPRRVVTSAGTYHETARCPGVRTAAEWRYWRDEDCMYADLGGGLERCVRCYAHRTYGFDEFAGDEERQQVIGHA